MHTTTTRTPIEMGSDEDDGFEGLLDDAASVVEPFPGSGPRPGLFLCLLMSTGTTRRKRRGHSYRYVHIHSLSTRGATRYRRRSHGATVGPRLHTVRYIVPRLSS